MLYSLTDLEEFIKAADEGLSKRVEKGDYNGLVEIMGHLMAVKERQTVTDAMFEPLKQTVELLKAYEQQLPEEVRKQLEVSENSNRSCQRECDLNSIAVILKTPLPVIRGPHWIVFCYRGMCLDNSKFWSPIEIFF